MTMLKKQDIVFHDVSQFDIGDQIRIGKYTATCQKNTDEGVIFLLDQYLDKLYRMNSDNTNDGGYAKSLLRAELNEDFASDPNFDALRENLLPVFESDLVRIPTVGEFFDRDDFYEMDEIDDAKQWELMKDWQNRIASRKSEKYEWGWLQNKVEESAADFACVGNYGNSRYSGASCSFGVRPVFMIKKMIKKAKRFNLDDDEVKDLLAFHAGKLTSKADELMRKVLDTVNICAELEEIQREVDRLSELLKTQ